MKEADDASALAQMRKANNEAEEEPEKNNYGDVNFWNKRYAMDLVKKGKKFTYDWYVPYEKVQQLIESFARANKADRVLIVGCGNSTLAEKMYKAGFTNITGIDFSHEVIDINIAKYRDWPGMEFFVANVMMMDDFRNRAFDLIIDKGCLDAIMCSFDSIDHLNRMNKEIFRVLAYGGQFFSIGFGVAEMRVPHLQRDYLTWDVTVSPVVGSSQHRIYRCEKEDPTTVNLEKAHRKAQSKGTHRKKDKR